MGELQRVSVQRSAALPAARVRDTPKRARQVEREPAARPLQRMMAIRALQPQLAVGAVDDPFEREAERTADAVTSTNQPAPSAFGVRPLAASLLRVVQRAIGKGETPAKKDDDDKTKKVQKKPAANAGPELVPRGIETQIQTLSAGGDPLAPSLRSTFEPRFGYDFGSVRTHSGSDAADAARALGARAFTVGDHIFFGAGEFQPSSAAGQRLIAHELTHTIQQQSVAVRTARLFSATSRVQRGWLSDLKDDVLDKLSEWASELRPYELLTVLLGRDPITDKQVDSSARNWIHAALQLVPSGMEIFADLEKNKTIEKTADWFHAEVAKLSLTWTGIKALFSLAWDELGISDIIHPLRAWEKIKAIFGPTLRRIANFASAVGSKILEFIRTGVLLLLAAWTRGKLPGYTLLTFILHKDPLTDAPVERTAKTFIKAVLEFVPGGSKLFANLEKSKTLEKTGAWLQGEITKLGITWETIKALFSQVWAAFSIPALLHPLGLLDKIIGIFAPHVRRIVDFASAVGKKVLEIIFEGVMALAGSRGQQVLQMLRRAGAVLGQIVAHPVQFARNLLSALKLGFTQFLHNLGRNLRTALVIWLGGALDGTDLQLPEQWDAQGVLSLVLQILGITWQRLRQKIVAKIGEERMQALEKTYDLVKGGPIALLDRILVEFGNLWETVLAGISEWLTQRIQVLVWEHLGILLLPVAGEIIEVILLIYNTIKFFIERARQIAATVEAIGQSISLIVAGTIGPAADAVERAMVRTLPMVITFLTDLIGLGDVGMQIRQVIEGLRDRVCKAIDKALVWLMGQAKAIVGTVKDVAGKIIDWWKAKKKFHYPDGEEHEVGFEGEGASADLVVRTSPQKMDEFFTAWRSDLDAIQGDPKKKGVQGKALSAARTKYDGIKALQKALTAPVAKGTVDADRQEKAAQLTTQLFDLADTLALHDVGSKTPFPPPVLPAFANGVLASGFTAEYINKDIAVGTASSSHTGSLRGWDYIQQNKLSDRAAWVKMHLLPAVLGGKAVDSNLVPARGPQTNLRYANAVEYKARAALTASAPDREQMIWYTVEVDFHQKPFAGFPSRLAVQWGGYDFKGTNWAKRSKASGNLSSSEDPPSPGEDAVLKINREGRVRIAAVLGVDDYFARVIIELRPASGFFEIGELEALLKVRESKKAGRNLIPDFSSNLDKVIAGAAAGKVRFD